MRCCGNRNEAEIDCCNEEAFRLTIQTGEAHYWSRSRQQLWRKGATSGLVQRIREIRVDDDQDSVWFRVEVEGSGASCHVGYPSCFYIAVPFGQEAGEPLVFREETKKGSDHRFG